MFIYAAAAQIPDPAQTIQTLRRELAA